MNKFNSISLDDLCNYINFDIQVPDMHLNKYKHRLGIILRELKSSSICILRYDFSFKEFFNINWKMIIFLSLLITN